MLGYSLGRLWIEFIRSGLRSELAGVRVNIWVMLALIIGSTAYLFWGRGDDGEADAEAAAPEGPQDQEAENISLET